LPGPNLGDFVGTFENLLRHRAVGKMTHVFEEGASVALCNQSQLEPLHESLNHSLKDAFLGLKLTETTISYGDLHSKCQTTTRFAGRLVNPLPPFSSGLLMNDTGDSSCKNRVPFLSCLRYQALQKFQPEIWSVLL
jgi:hypothetical protein